MTDSNRAGGSSKARPPTGECGNETTPARPSYPKMLRKETRNGRVFVYDDRGELLRTYPAEWSR